MIFLSIEYSSEYTKLFGIKLGKLPKSIRVNRIGKLL